jgi:pimeloyl-ACP methyl ester carboxylesterase
MDEYDRLAAELFGVPQGGQSGNTLTPSGSGAPSPGGMPTGYPKDFPKLTDSGGSGAGQPIAGWGGDPSKDRAGNRAALKRTPVILIHGNGQSAFGSIIDFQTDFSWKSMYRHLRGLGYVDSEIWSFSYLGRMVFMAQLDRPYSTNIDDVRSFIEAVRVYLGVKKVDIIAFSLGSGLAKGYMNGLQRDASWDHSKNRADAVGTLVALGGGNYGLGKSYDMYAAIVGEMLTDFPFEKKRHMFGATKDDTPYGPPVANQKVEGTAFDAPKWNDSHYRGVTGLDNGAISYVALWAEGDLVDNNWDKTCRLWGADLNKGFKLGDGLGGHARLIHDKNVFDAFAPYLNRVGVVKGYASPGGATPATGGSGTGGSCKDCEASNYAHVKSGRAEVCGTLKACARGSKQMIGYYSMMQKTWLRETKPGYFEQGKCP